MLQRVFPQLHATLFVQKLNFGSRRVHNAGATTDCPAGSTLTQFSVLSIKTNNLELLCNSYSCFEHLTYRVSTDNDIRTLAYGHPTDQKTHFPQTSSLPLLPMPPHINKPNSELPNTDHLLSSRRSPKMRTLSSSAKPTFSALAQVGYAHLESPKHCRLSQTRSSRRLNRKSWRAASRS